MLSILTLHTSSIEKLLFYFPVFAKSTNKLTLTIHQEGPLVSLGAEPQAN